MPEESDYENHRTTVVEAILAGTVVPFLGAGVNLGDVAADPQWLPGTRLPSGKELARFLADDAGDLSPPGSDLTRVSQYIDVMRGWGPLYKLLREIFAVDYPSTILHRFLASLPPMLRERGADCQLIVTTNYDDVLERTFEDAGEPYDLVTYIAIPGHPDRGRFRHRPPHGDAVVVRAPNEYELPLHERTTILKIHGAVDRKHQRFDSYVIAEDHYIDYMARDELSTVLPVTLKEALEWSHVLFLGYSMHDWNLRVFFRRLWGDGAEPRYNRWAIQSNPDALDRKLWARHGVEILDRKLCEYIAGLEERLREVVHDEQRTRS